MEGSPCVCNDCGKTFMDDAKLGLHHYAVHSEKPFECSQCGAKGNGVQKFKNHIKRLNVLSAKRALGQNET